MRSFWLVARHEFERTALRRSFLLVTLAIPVGLALIVALGFLMQTAGRSKAPVGYVDHAGVLPVPTYPGDPAPEAAAGGKIPIYGYVDEEAATAALERGEIGAFFVLPEGYPQRLSTDLYYLDKPPSDEEWGQFDDFLRANLVARFPEAVQARLLAGPSIRVQDVASGRTWDSGAIINIILPLVLGMLFFFAISMAAGYMMQVVADEKENRTMEVLVTSLTPGQLIGGKAAGLLAASLAQLGVYAVAGVVALAIARTRVAELQQLTVPWDYLGLMLAFFLPSFALVAGVMIAIGGAVTETQQGQQVTGIVTIVFAMPLFFLPILFQNPGHPLMVFFTLFPPTSMITVAMRWALGSVPLWQVGLGWVLLVTTAAAMLWAAARIFRAGMLVYGQPLNLKAMAAAVRGQ